MEGSRQPARLSPGCWEAGLLGQSACGQACGPLSAGGSGSYTLFWCQGALHVCGSVELCVPLLHADVFSVLFWCPRWWYGGLGLYPQVVLWLCGLFFLS